MPPQSET